MLARGKGQLAIVSSLGSWRGLPSAAAYTASKAAANAYCEALNAETRRRGVAVSCICPGFVDTPMIDLAKKRTMFVWDAGRAARRIADGLEKRRRWIVFPLATRLGMIAVRLVPAPLFEWIAEKVILKPLLRPRARERPPADAAHR
jgi:short-subunit dehydrogenase